LFAAAVCILGAFASLLRGGKYHYVEEPDEKQGEKAEKVETLDVPADRVPAQEAVAETEPLLVD
jgi:hypothetical protein